MKLDTTETAREAEIPVSAGELDTTEAAPEAETQVSAGELDMTPAAPTVPHSDWRRRVHLDEMAWEENNQLKELGVEPKLFRGSEAVYAQPWIPSSQIPIWAEETSDDEHLCEDTNCPSQYFEKQWFGKNDDDFSWRMTDAQMHLVMRLMTATSPISRRTLVEHALTWNNPSTRSAVHVFGYMAEVYLQRGGDCGEWDNKNGQFIHGDSVWEYFLPYEVETMFGFTHEDMVAINHFNEIHAVEIYELAHLIIWLIQKKQD